MVNYQLVLFSVSMIDLRKPEPMSIEDIAWRLSNKYRWCAEIPVSVASHSLAVRADLSLRDYAPEIQLMGLLHDAVEAPLPDMPTPLKPFTTVEVNGAQIMWRALEDMWGEVLLPALGCGWPLHPAVKESDLRTMTFEAYLWGMDVPPERLSNDVSIGRGRFALTEPQPKVMADFLKAYRELIDGTKMSGHL